MPLEYDPKSPRGNQWTVTYDGQRHSDLPACAVKGLLMRRGLSLRQIEAEMAAARLQPATV